MSFIIRNAKSGDIQEIYNLVLELAIYEKEPEAVTASIQDYIENFESNVFDAIVAEKDGKIVGTCIYYMTWSTWKGRMLYLEDFVVNQTFRRKGIGQLLFDGFLAKAKALDAVMVKWQVLNWNVPAIKFYEKNHAIIEKGWWNVKMFF